jgi:hypothetical protein
LKENAFSIEKNPVHDPLFSSELSFEKEHCFVSGKRSAVKPKQSQCQIFGHFLKETLRKGTTGRKPVVSKVHRRGI